MFRTFLLLSTVLTLASCSQDIVINTIQKYPDEFDGAGCGYYPLKNETNLVLLTSEHAFMVINGKAEIFEPDSYRTITTSRSKSFYTNANYDITVDLISIEEIDYDSKFKGFIKVRSKSNGNETSIKIEGHCGC